MNAGAIQLEPYRDTPTGLGRDLLDLQVATHAGAAGFQLAGTGVGPQFLDDDLDNTLDVGSISFGTPATAGFLISNIGNLGLGALSDLTITGVTVVGSNGNALWSTDVTAGTVIPAGGSHMVNIFAQYAGNPQSLATATLVIATDQGAALGGDGIDYHFQLQGYAIPEPGAIALAAIGTLGLVGFALRRRQSRTNRALILRGFDVAF